MPRCDARPSTPLLPLEGANDVLRQVYTEVKQLQPHSRWKHQILCWRAYKSRTDFISMLRLSAMTGSLRMRVLDCRYTIHNEVVLHDTCARTRTCIHSENTKPHTRTHTHVHTYMHTHSLTHAHTPSVTHTRTHTHTHAHTLVHACTHAHAHPHAHTYTLAPHISFVLMFVY